MSEKLTSRQAEVLEFIQGAVREHGLPPTRAEIAAAFGFRSPNAAEEHLRALARKGAIDLSSGMARGINLREAVENMLGLPLIGRVAAGSPILAQENVTNRYQLDPAMFKPRADYLLKVKGLSMKDIGILDGDLLAVHRTTEARNSQIVVARVGNEVTVKRYRKKGNVVELLPENTEMEPIIVNLDQEDFSIEGLAVGVIRNGMLQ
jgi:repressor LexA